MGTLLKTCPCPEPGFLSLLNFEAFLNYTSCAFLRDPHGHFFFFFFVFETDGESITIRPSGETRYAKRGAGLNLPPNGGRAKYLGGCSAIVAAAAVLHTYFLLVSKWRHRCY